VRPPGNRLSPRNRYGESRRPIERIFEIHQTIQRGSFPNCRTLGEQIGVIPKTIQRDVTFMQKDLGLPIEYDSLRHGYHYERPVTDFPLLKVSVGDVVALFLARKAIAPIHGSPLEETSAGEFPSPFLHPCR
jgi:predicted DNA-binding transcriptional regulator YafY